LEGYGRTYSSRTRIVSASKVHHCDGVAGVIAARSAVEEAGAFEPVYLLAGPEDMEVGCCEASREGSEENAVFHFERVAVSVGLIDDPRSG
jgi:hypothetical protein